MRVNGSLLGHFISKRVSIIGTVQSVLPSNLGFTIRSTDDCTITINLKEPLSENVNGLIEVHGIGIGPAAVDCDYYLMFPLELAKTFEAALDNEAVKLGYHTANAWH